MPTIPRGVWLAYAMAAGLFGLQALLEVVGAPPPQTGAAPSALAVDFGGTGAIEMARVNDALEAYATILVRNDSKADGEGTIQVTAVDRDGGVVTSTHDVRLAGRTVTPVTVRLPGGFNQTYDRRLPARGVAVLSVLEKGKADGPVSLKTREVLVRQVEPSAGERIIATIGLAAGAIVFLVGLGIAARKASRTVKGEPKWTAQSWSSNLALGGALLTPLVTIAGLPAVTHYASKTSYTTLSVLYGALVTLAPALFGLLKVGAPTPVDADAVARAAAHTVRMFALAAAVTVWATVGQLVTAALLVLELAAARVLSGVSAYTAVGLFATAAALVAVHAIRALIPGPAPATRPATPGAGTVPVDPPGAASEGDWCLL